MFDKLRYMIITKKYSNTFGKVKYEFTPNTLLENQNNIANDDEHINREILNTLREIRDMVKFFYILSIICLILFVFSLIFIIGK